jgi:hypothetical protein
MKAATGELNLTVITIIAIGAILTFFITVLWPIIQDSIQSGWEDSTNGEQTGYVEVVETDLF